MERPCAASDRDGNVQIRFAKAIGTACFLSSAFGITLVMADAALDGQPMATSLRLRATAISQMFIHDVLNAGTRSETQIPVAPAAQQVMYPEGYENIGRVFHISGLRLPDVKTAREAFLPDQTLVIGVVIEGNSRAYLPEAMQDLSAHVINDRIGDVFVTVTYCSILKCTRVFTRAGAIEPLDVSLGGIHEGKMALEIDGEMFAQDAADLPVDDLEFSRTSWGDWKASHPESDVFIGNVLDQAPTSAD